MTNLTALIRSAFAVLLLIVTLTSVRGQVTVTPDTDSGCAGSFTQLSDIVLSETGNDDFGLGTGSGTIVLTATSGTFDDSASPTAFFSNGGVDATVVVTNSDVTITVTHISPGHEGEPNTLTISNIEYDPGIGGPAEIQYQGGTLTFTSGLTSGAVVANFTGESIPLGQPDSRTICSQGSLSITLQTSPPNTPSGTTFSWSDPDGPGPAGPGGGVEITDGPFQNSSGAPMNFSYSVTPTSPLGCIGSPFNIDVTVNAEPWIQTAQSTLICGGTSPDYQITLLASPGSVLNWGDPDDVGPATEGVNVPADDPFHIADVLTNFTNAQTQVDYTVQGTSAEGCIGAAEIITIYVDPQPFLASGLDATVCSDIASGVILDVDPASVPAFDYQVVTIFVNGLTPGGSNVSAGAGYPPSAIASDTYTNTTSAPVTVDYTIAARSSELCSGNSEILSVTVDPEPVLSSTLSTSQCSDVPSGITLDTEPGSEPATEYDITVTVPGTLVASGSNAGSGPAQPPAAISGDVFTTTTFTAEVVNYDVTPVSAVGCIGDQQTVFFTVNPLPDIIVAPPSQTINSGDPTAITLSSSVSGTTFNYTVTAPPSISGASAGAGTSITQTLTSMSAFDEIVSYDITATTPAGCFDTYSPANVTVKAGLGSRLLDSLALVAIYNATGGATWTNNGSWLSDVIDNWYGVTVTGQRVTGLSLTSNNMAGPLPPQIGDLNALYSLNLDYNEITGNIPSTIGDLVNLQTLHLSNNKLTGSIPSSIGNLVNLYGLALGLNDLSGAIPTEFGNLTALQLLSLSDNQLSGPIPTSFGNLVSLTDANLSFNKFTGPIPSTFGNLIAVQNLYMNNNALDGNIPVEIGDMVALYNLNLSYNNLSGEIPASIATITSLQNLLLHNNRLSGDLPPGITSLVGMSAMNLSQNELTSIPDFSGMSGDIDVSNNFLDFDDLEQNADVIKAILGPQKDFPVGDTLEVTVGNAFSLSWDAGGTATSYQWHKNGIGPISGATAGTYDAPPAPVAASGSYYAEATSATVAGVTLRTTFFLVEVYSSESAEEAGYAYLKQIGAEEAGIPQTFPGRVVMDGNGDIYFQDQNVIRKYNQAGDELLVIDAVGTGPEKLGCISDMVVDANNNLYVSSECSSNVIKYDPAGNVIFDLFIPINGASAYGIAINNAQELMVAPRYETPYSIRKFTIDGSPLGDVSLSGGPAFSIYLDIETDPTGNFYLSDANDGRIDKFASDGTFMASYDLTAAGFPFWGGWDFALAPSGDLYLVSANQLSLVFQFGPAYNFIRSFGAGQLLRPQGITYSPAGLIVGDEYAGLLVFDEAGTYLSAIGPVKSADEQFNNPADITIDSRGNWYIADSYNAKIKKFDFQGNLIDVFGSRGTADGEFSFPVAVDVDAEDNLFVLDNGNNRIQKFAPDGTHILSFGSAGTGDGQLSLANDLAVAPNGDILVADAGNSRIQKFTNDGSFVSAFGTAGTAQSQFQGLSAIAVQENGEVLAFDNNARLQRFDNQGTFISEVSLLGALNFQVADVSVDLEGFIYVAHNYGGTVKKFAPDGSLLTNIALAVSDFLSSAANGEVIAAAAVKPNLTGDTVWVADSRNNRVSIFVANNRTLSASDSLTLVDLYNSTAGTTWTNNTNWLTGPVDTWHGLTITGGKVRSIMLNQNNLVGTLPASLSGLDELTNLSLAGNNLSGALDPVTTLSVLRSLDISDNTFTGDVPLLSPLLERARISYNGFTGLTDIPGFLRVADVSFNNLTSLGDLSGNNLDTLLVHDNNLTFEDLEPNMSVPVFAYSPQDSVEVKTSVLKQLGVKDSLRATIGGLANIYTWFKNGVEISSDTVRSLRFASVTEDDDAIYHYAATNSVVPGLTLFSRATEYKVSSLRRDSIALHAFFEATNGPEWVNNENWIATPISGNDWFGVTITDNRVTSISLPGNNLTGFIPTLFTDIENLATVDFSNNKIDSLPTLTALSNITAFNVSANSLHFSSLESNVTLPGIDYSNQADIGTPSTVYLSAGEPYQFSLDVGGMNNQYQWKRNEESITGATQTDYHIESMNRSAMGRYTAEITNTIVTDLVLKTAVDTLIAVADLSGVVMATNDPPAPAAEGHVILLKIQSEGGYDSVATQEISEDGVFRIENVVLDDYQIVSLIDTITYAGAIPTYYKNTIFWEEADTLFVNDDMDSLFITTQYRPSEIPVGDGVISGYLVEDDGTAGGRLKANKRVANAGVSVRRVQQTGRGKDVTYTLVAYQFTTDEGEFRFANLSEATYRLNIQYPGYPMDEESFIEITIGSGLVAEKTCGGCG